MNQNQSIRHGQVWLDTEGKPIQAHGGSIFFENDTFYWYGENKEKTRSNNDIWNLFSSSRFGFIITDQKLTTQN